MHTAVQNLSSELAICIISPICAHGAFPPGKGLPELGGIPLRVFRVRRLALHHGGFGFVCRCSGAHRQGSHGQPPPLALHERRGSGWVVEGNLASLAPDCQIGPIGFANLANKWCAPIWQCIWRCCSIWHFRLPLTSGCPSSSLKTIGLFMFCKDPPDWKICQIARLEHPPDWPDRLICQIGQICEGTRLAVGISAPDWRSGPIARLYILPDWLKPTDVEPTDVYPCVLMCIKVYTEYSLCTNSVYWLCVLALCTGSVYWLCIWALCTNSVYWLCVLALCTCFVYWLCVLTLCTGSVHWLCVLALRTGSVYLFCVLALCANSVYWLCVLALCAGSVY